jgi:hypothetical protein
MSELEEQKVIEILDKILIQIDDINNSLKNILEGKNETDQERKPV